MSLLFPASADHVERTPTCCKEWASRCSSNPRLPASTTFTGPGQIFTTSSSHPESTLCGIGMTPSSRVIRGARIIFHDIDLHYVRLERKADPLSDSSLRIIKLNSRMCAQVRARRRWRQVSLCEERAQARAEPTCSFISDIFGGG